MTNRILIKAEPSRATKIEIRRIIAEHKAKPVKKVQCPVCGTRKNRLDPCCDETEFSNRIQQDEDDLRTLAGDYCD